jgi:hypothetical protein
LEKGPCPSYIKQIKRQAAKNLAAKNLLGVQEISFKNKSNQKCGRTQTGDYISGKGVYFILQ